MRKRTLTIGRKAADGKMVLQVGATVGVYVAGTDYTELATGVENGSGIEQNPLTTDAIGQVTIAAPGPESGASGVYDVRAIPAGGGAPIDYPGEIWEDTAAIGAQAADNAAATAADRVQTGLDLAATVVAKTAAQTSEANAAVSAAAAQTAAAFATNRPPVRLATTGPLPTNTYNNAAGTLTMTATGVLTIDGAAVALNDDVVVAYEADQTHNMIARCTTAGAVGVAAVLTRRTTEDTGAELAGACVEVLAGSTNAGARFRVDQSSITLGTTAVTFSKQAGSIAAESALRVAGDAAVSSNLLGTQMGLAASFDVAKVTAAARVGGNYFTISGGAYDWGIGMVGGVDVAAGLPFDTAAFWLQADSAGASVRYRLWSRPLDAAWISAGPGDPSDTQHGSTVLASVASLALQPGGARAYVSFTLDTQVTVQSGRLYIHELEVLDSGGTRVLSAIEYKSVTDLTTDQYRKWRRAGGPNNSWSNQVTSTTFVYCYDLRLTGYTAKTQPLHYTPTVETATAAINGLTVTIAGKLSSAGAISDIAATLTLDAATGGTVTDEAMTLTPATGAGITYGYLTNKSAHADLSSVVVKDASTLATLTNGTDYWSIPELGCFSLPNGASGSRAVLVSYTWKKMRYDLIHYTPSTGVIAVAKGTERERDQAEFIPATPTSAIPLFNIHVRSGGNIAVPVYDVAETVRRARRSEYNEEVARNKRLLRPVLKKLRAGQAVKVMSYGDSNAAQMCSGYSLAAIRSTANTIWHDRTKDAGGLLQSPAYGADVLATIPTYDNGDGTGAVHTRFGFAWELIRAMQAGYSSTISYSNRSIPGSNSTNGTYQGLDSVRLAAATAEAPDVVLIVFGQNDFGQAYTLANVMAICQAFQAVGSIPIVMGCFRPHAADLHGTQTTANWLIIQRMLREAAYAVDAPHVSTLLLHADGEVGAAGLSPYDLCAATKDVHVGIREHQIIGRRLSAWLD